MNIIDTPQPIQERNALVDHANEKFFHLFGEDVAWTVCAPGRINIIGEHTDYSGGFSMPTAINRWVTISLRERKDNLIQVVSDNYEGKFTFNLGDTPVPEVSWQKFVWGAVDLFSKTHHIDVGFDAYITGNVPIGSGVSSSAALEVALVNALNACYSTAMSGLDIIKLGQQIEHQYLGVMCGLMDQYASQFSREGNVLILNFRDLTHEYGGIRMPDYSWVLVNSMVKRELAASAYTQRVNEMAAASASFQKAGVAHLADATTEDLIHIKDPVVRNRARHFITANERVKLAVTAFNHNDLAQVGQLMNASHRSLSQDYEVSCEELDFLAMLAQQTDGCLGSRMMGGGFGGCTINLVANETLPEFTSSVSRQYIEKYDKQPEVSAFRIVEGATVL